MIDSQLKIMLTATKVHLKRGKDLEEILAMWPNLTEEDRTYIREHV